MQCVEHRNPVTGWQSPAYVIGELYGLEDDSTMDQAEEEEEEKGFSFAPPPHGSAGRGSEFEEMTVQRPKKSSPT